MNLYRFFIICSWYLWALVVSAMLFDVYREYHGMAEFSGMCISGMCISRIVNLFDMITMKELTTNRCLSLYGWSLPLPPPPPHHHPRRPASSFELSF